MTNDIIARTEALLAGITQGEWKYADGKITAHYSTEDGIYRDTVTEATCEDGYCYTSLNISEGDAAFIVAAPDLACEYMEEVKALRHAVWLTLEWFGPSFEHDDDTECPVCDELTEHMPNCPYPALMRWSKG